MILWVVYLVVKADMDEVSVLQPSAEQDGGEMAAEIVSTYDVIVCSLAPTAKTHTHTQRDTRPPLSTVPVGLSLSAG